MRTHAVLSAGRWRSISLATTGTEFGTKVVESTLMFGKIGSTTCDIQTLEAPACQSTISLVFDNRASFELTFVIPTPSIFLRFFDPELTHVDPLECARMLVHPDRLV